jgi:hypothetical protein
MEEKVDRSIDCPSFDRKREKEENEKVRQIDSLILRSKD